MKSSFDLNCLNWKTNQRLVNFPFCDSEFSLPFLSFCFCSFFKHFFLSLIEFLDFFFFFLTLYFSCFSYFLFLLFLLSSILWCFCSGIFSFISFLFSFFILNLEFFLNFLLFFLLFHLVSFCCCLLPYLLSFLIFTFLVFCLYFSSFLLLNVRLCVLVAVALRNQKIKMSSGVGQITKVANSVSIPMLSQLTICFEVERKSPKQVWINVTDYVRSFWFD